MRSERRHLGARGERSPLSAEALARHFARGARVEALPGVGHWPQREAPDAVARAVLA